MTGLTLDQLLAIRPSVANEELHWSRDGREIRFISARSGAPELWSVTPEHPVPTQLSVGLAGSAPRRSPVSDAVAYVSSKSGADEVWLWTPDGRPDMQLTRLGGRIEGLSWGPDGSWLAVAGFNGAAFDIFRITVPEGHTERLTSGDRYDVNPSVTPDGRVCFVRLNEDWTDHDVLTMNADGGDRHVVLRDTGMFDYHYGREFGYPTLSPDGQRFLFRSYRSGWINIWCAPVDGYSEPYFVAAAPADQSDAVWTPDGARIAYIENDNGTLALRIADGRGGGELDGFGQELAVYSRPAWSPDGRRIAYIQNTPFAPSELWLLELETGHRRALTHSAPAQFDAHLVRPTKLSYKSFDGLPISAYHYAPPAPADGTPQPVIVLAHGGPTSQFMDSFSLHAQFFASAGYHLLLPNVRGSSGYGREFEDLNNGDWGHGDLRDVIAGLQHLRQLPDVHPELAGITGTSYGGILSMAATVWAAPGVFQAAVPCSGYSDFIYTVGEEEIRHSKQLYYEFGKLPEAQDVYERCSPIYWANQAATPCFIIQGEGQYPGSFSSKDFALALEAAYKPFWFKAYQDENYYVSSPANVRQMLLDMRMFFDFYLKGIPHAPLNTGDAPLTRLNGVISYRSWLSTLPFIPKTDGPQYGIDA